MYKNALRKMLQCVRQGLCKATSHAYEEMKEDELVFEDAKYAILNGAIRDRQWDSDYEEFKYIVNGRAISGDEIVVVVKIEPTRETTTIITVYRV